MKMNFEITPDNKPYLDARGKVILNACPGSGKTTAVSYKLTTLTTECENEFGRYAGIACLSFTNVAKDEIANTYEKIKVSRLHYPHIVSTIDSFVNQYITLPFYHLLGKSTIRPSILNTVAFLDDMYWGNFRNKRNQLLKVSYPPSKIKIEIDGSHSFDGHKPNPTIVNSEVFRKYAKSIKKWQVENGYLNNDDATFIAAYLLETYPSIGRSLVQRFPYIIVDEAQDTSEIQYKIFDLLIDAGLSNIEFVGDPYQSLYEFREARPDLFIQRFNDTSEWQATRLTHCRRSSQSIISMYSIFRSVGEEPIISACNHETNNEVHVIRYNENDFSSLTTKYQGLVDENSLNYILVRGGTHLERFGVKPVSEEPWKNSLAKTLLNAQRHFSMGNSKTCIDELRMFLAEITLPAANFKDKKNEEQKLKEDIDLNIKLFEFVKNMPDINDTLENWTTIMTTYIKNNLGFSVDLQLKQKGAKFYSQNLKDLLFPKVEMIFPISTIHKVKGMTFDSVLVVLSKKSSGEQISLSDFIKPTGLPNEKQRMLYVALSRPKSLCCLAIPQDFSEEQIQVQLGANIRFV